MADRGDHSGTTPKRRRLAIVLAALAALFLLAVFLLTDSEPRAPVISAPDATQVGAGRDAYRQLRDAKGSTKGVRVDLEPIHLAGLGAVASHGFRPDRLHLSTKGASVRVEASKKLPLGRWLNVTAIAESPSEKFPETRLKIGSVALPAWLSRIALQTGRLLATLRMDDVPPLDEAVRQYSVRDGRVSAIIRLPGKSGLVDRMGGIVARPVDARLVARAYCALVTQQGSRPSAEFAEQVRRAFARSDGSVETNRAAFVALGIFLVDDRVAALAQVPSDKLDPCRARRASVQLHGRGDWPKHWALSAALSVLAGTQLSEAVGEWKELADSLERGSRFAGRGTGFSMTDLAADRAGFLTAAAATDPDRAGTMARRLANTSAQQLLPISLTKQEDGLTEAEFRQRYGGLDDPRYAARVAEIDAELKRAGID